MHETRLLTINEAAKEFGVSTYLLRTACTDGRLHHLKSGVKVLLHEEVLNEFLKGS